jgi:hypothetical protein
MGGCRTLAHVHGCLRSLGAVASMTPFLSSIGLGCYMAYCIIAYDMETGGLTRPGGVPPNPFDTTDWIVFGVILSIVVLVQLVCSVLFTLHATRDPRLQNLGKVLWIVGFFTMGMFALPLYFIFLLWRDPPPARIADLESLPTKE